MQCIALEVICGGCTEGWQPLKRIKPETLKRLIMAYDNNGDGLLTSMELSLMTRQLYCVLKDDNPNISERDVQRIYSVRNLEYDSRNRDSKIDEAELSDFLEGKRFYKEYEYYDRYRKNSRR